MVFFRDEDILTSLHISYTQMAFILKITEKNDFKNKYLLWKGGSSDYLFYWIKIIN